VLRPGGSLHFVEHTASLRPVLAATQRVIQPAWGLWAGGCHLDRDIPGEITRTAYAIHDRHDAGWFVTGRATPQGRTTGEG
jgi:hypothetical protein